MIEIAGRFNLGGVIEWRKQFHHFRAFHFFLSGVRFNGIQHKIEVVHGFGTFHAILFHLFLVTFTQLLDHKRRFVNFSKTKITRSNHDDDPADHITPNGAA
ncbi:Uncharacterised protein [Vibrio cholerae]|nr:Uncharacterised protein [Vibrio cholerae]CSC80734.1 Uncharacterised protein [Vibrio cholerae]